MWETKTSNFCVLLSDLVTLPIRKDDLVSVEDKNSHLGELQ